MIDIVITLVVGSLIALFIYFDHKQRMVELENEIRAIELQGTDDEG